jgi:hypothetical protein
VSNSGVIVLTRQSYSDAAAGCQALGEQLWSLELNTASIQANLDYLKYQGRIDESSRFWIGSQGNSSRAIGFSGTVSDVDAASRLPALCTQSAPFSNDAIQDTSERWQVSVRANNEDLTG